MATPNEFFLFKNYLSSVKKWLQNNCYLTRYSPEKNVKVEWLSPSKAFIKYIIPVIERENGVLENPLITFKVASLTPAASGEIPGQWAHFYSNLGTGYTRGYIHPTIYSIVLTVTIFTSLQSDMDIILYQLISKTQHKKAAFMIENQWCELGSGEPRDESNTEPPEAQDKIIKWSIDLRIPRAYLPIEAIDYGAIETIELGYDVQLDPKNF